MKWDLSNDIDVGVRNYFNSLKPFESLSKEEEHRLLKRYRYHNDLAARDKLITSNLKFACSVAAAYRGKGVSFSDLISEANDGLLESIDRFDLNQDIKLFSYSVWWIKQRVKAAINRELIMPTSELPNENDAQLDNSDDDIAVPTKKTIDPAFVEEESRQEDETDKKRFLNEVVKVLSDRERDMVYMSFGMYGEEYKLEDIGKKYGITKERARQIIERAMTKIRCQAMNVENKYL